MSAYDVSNNFAGTLSFNVTRTNADTTAPTVTSITPVSLDTFKIKFSEAVAQDATVPTNGYGDLTITGLAPAKLVVGDLSLAAVSPLTLSTDGTELTVKLAAPLVAGLHTVTLNNFFDASQVKQTTAYSKVVNFANDTIAPKYVSASVANLGGVDTLLLKFDDSDIQINVAANAITDARYVKDYVEYTLNAASTPAVPFGTAALYDPDGDGKTDTIQIPLPAGLSNGDYTVTLAANVVADKAAATAALSNNNVATTVNFSYTASTNTVKPAVVDNNNIKTDGIGAGYTAQAIASPNDITLTFTKDVTSATALNASNYLVDGVAAFDKATFVGNKHTVRLTLKQGAIAATANRAFTIQNVADETGVVMDPATFIQPFIENVAPTVKSAAVTAADQLTVTFSEAMTPATLTDKDDFELYIGGVKYAGTLTAAGAADTYTVTLGTPFVADDLTKDIQLKVLSTSDAADASAIQNVIVGGATVNVTK